MTALDATKPRLWMELHAKMTRLFYKLGNSQADGAPDGKRVSILLMYVINIARTHTLIH